MYNCFFTARLADAQGKLAALEEVYSGSKRQSAEELHKLKLELQTKDSQITKVQQETEITQTENSKLADFIKQQEGWVARLSSFLSQTDTRM